MGKKGLKTFKRLGFYVSDKESKRLVCSAHLSPRLGSLTVTLFLEVRTGALREETQGSRVRRQMKVFLSLARKVLRELSKSSLGLVIIVLSLSCVRLCNPTDCSTPGSPVLHYLSEFAQIHVHCVSDAIKIYTSHPLSSPSPPAFNLPQHQGLFK